MGSVSYGGKYHWEVIWPRERIPTSLGLRCDTRTTYICLPKFTGYMIKTMNRMTIFVTSHNIILY